MCFFIVRRYRSSVKTWKKHRYTKDLGSMTKYCVMQFLFSCKNNCNPEILPYNHEIKIPCDYSRICKYSSVPYGHLYMPPLWKTKRASLSKFWFLKIHLFFYCSFIICGVHKTEWFELFSIDLFGQLVSLYKIWPNTIDDQVLFYIRLQRV